VLGAGEAPARTSASGIPISGDVGRGLLNDPSAVDDADVEVEFEPEAGLAGWTK
jgi:hypothetical protein